MSSKTPSDLRQRHLCYNEYERKLRAQWERAACPELACLMTFSRAKRVSSAGTTSNAACSLHEQASKQPDNKRQTVLVQPDVKEDVCSQRAADNVHTHEKASHVNMNSRWHACAGVLAVLVVGKSTQIC
jgi:hypothetical protein